MSADQNSDVDTLEPQYSMKYRKLGTCIIINNKIFHPKTGVSIRKGTDKDSMDLSNCFQNLGFAVNVHNNLTHKGMEHLMQSVANSDHSDSACFVCVLLSHGDEGQICGTDEEIPIKTLTKLFQGDHCKSLLGKPKLFFIQACRGLKRDEGVLADSVSAESSLEADTITRNRIPLEADFLFAYATVPGYVSWRDSVHGTWFAQALCRALNQHGKQLEIMHILTQVNNQVATKPGEKKQIPSIESRLTKYLYFKTFDIVNTSRSNIIMKQQGSSASCSNPKKHFVDEHQMALIRGVPLLGPILDSLMSANLLTYEDYDTIRKAGTSYEQMRMLFYKYVSTWKDHQKDILENALRTNNQVLMENLEQSCPKQ